MSGFVVLAYLAIVLGAKGFTRRGLPWSETRRIRGVRGRVLGGLCLLLGAGLLAFATWGGSPADREALRVLLLGAVAGILGTLVVLADTASGPD